MVPMLLCVCFYTRLFVLIFLHISTPNLMLHIHTSTSSHMYVLTIKRTFIFTVIFIFTHNFKFDLIKNLGCILSCRSRLNSCIFSSLIAFSSSMRFIHVIQWFLYVFNLLIAIQRSIGTRSKKSSLCNIRYPPFSKTI